MYDIMELSNKSLEELYVIAENLNVKKVKSYSKDELVYKTAKSVAVKRIREKLIQNSGHLVTAVFCFRKVKYKD